VAASKSHSAGVGVLAIAGIGVAMVALPLMMLTVAVGSAGQGSSCGADASLTGAPLPPGGKVVGATQYGGPGDPSTAADHGAYVDHLTGHYAFAELSSAGLNYSALGGLAPHTLLQISYGGKSVIAEKLDVGRGGGPVGSPPTVRAIDLWWQTAAALGVSGSGLVSLAPAPPGTPESAALVPGAPISGGASASLVSDSAGGCVPASFAGADAIVALANSQVGTHDAPPGSNCTPYGPVCEEWCALFATWVWGHSGVGIPSNAYSGFPYTWAQAHGKVFPATATPSPGDLVFFGSGPGPGQSDHVGVITAVGVGGEITEVDGNYAHQVSRVGPYMPATATSHGQRAPIYGYAQPTP